MVLVPDHVLRYSGTGMEPAMSQSQPLIMIQFLAWVADRPRNYAQCMDAWRSTCPRLSVWEDAIIEDLVRIENDARRGVGLTERGRAVLDAAELAAVCASTFATSAPRRPTAAALRRR